MMLPTVSLIPRCAGMPGTGLATSAMSAGPTVSPAMSGSVRSGNDGSSRIAWSSDGHPSTCVAWCVSIMSSAAPGSKRSMTSTVAPDCSAAPRISVPPIQKNGNAQKNAGGAPSGARSAARPPVARITVPCVCTTPFGSALDPDVYVTCARSAGTTSASTRSSSSSVSPGGRSARRRSRSTGVAHARLVGPVTQTARSDGASGRNSRGPGRLGETGHAVLEHLLHVLAEHGARGEQRVDVADAQHRADLRRPVGRRQRHHERADAARRQPRDDPLLAVREVQADARALAHARREHPLRQAARRGLGLARTSSRRSGVTMKSRSP